MSTVGVNPVIIGSEIPSLQNEKEVSSLIHSLEQALNRLYYRRAEILTNLGVLNSQFKEKGVTEGIKKNISERMAYVKNELVNVQYQIDSNQNKIKGLKYSESSVNNKIISKKKILNNLVGGIVSMNKSDHSYEIDKKS